MLGKNFFKRNRITADIDSDEVLRSQGTAVDGTVVSIVKHNGKWQVKVVTDEVTIDNPYIKLIDTLPKGCRVGATVNVYIDSIEADGQYLIDI